MARPAMDALGNAIKAVERARNTMAGYMVAQESVNLSDDLKVKYTAFRRQSRELLLALEDHQESSE